MVFHIKPIPHLLAISINGHGSSDQAPSVDFDGVARPQGAGFDIGAFEYSR